MYRAEDEEILIKVRGPGQIGARAGRVEHQLGDELAYVARTASRGRQLVEVRDAGGCVAVAQPNQRGENLAQALHAHADARAVLRGARERLDQGRAMLACGLGYMGGGAQGVEHAPRAHWTDTIRELQHAKPADLIRGVARESQQRNQVLDVRGVEVAQAAVLDEGDPAARELELEQRRVVPGAK